MSVDRSRRKRFEESSKNIQKACAKYFCSDVLTNGDENKKSGSAFSGGSAHIIYCEMPLLPPWFGVGPRVTPLVFQFSCKIHIVLARFGSENVLIDGCKGEVCCLQSPHCTARYNKNSSGDEIANVNFLRRYGTYVLQNTKKENLLRLTN